MENLSTIPNNAVLVTADTVELYPYITHEAGIRVLRKALDKQGKNSIPTEDLVKMAKKTSLSLTVKLNNKF